MKLPVLKNFTVTKGVEFDYRFQWLVGSPTSTTPRNLTGYTASMVVTSWDGQTTYFTLGSSAPGGDTGIFIGGDTHDPTNGIIDILFVAADTAAITFEAARYNLVFTPPSAGPKRLLYGTVNVFGFLP